MMNVDNDEPNTAVICSIRNLWREGSLVDVLVRAGTLQADVCVPSLHFTHGWYKVDIALSNPSLHGCVVQMAEDDGNESVATKV